MSTETYYAVRESAVGGMVMTTRHVGKRAAIYQMRVLNAMVCKCGNCGDRFCTICEGQSRPAFEVIRVTITTTTEFIDTRDAPPDNGHHMSCMCSRCM